MSSQCLFLANALKINNCFNFCAFAVFQLEALNSVKKEGVFVFATWKGVGMCGWNCHGVSNPCRKQRNNARLFLHVTRNAAVTVGVEMGLQVNAPWFSDLRSRKCGGRGLRVWRITLFRSWRHLSKLFGDKSDDQMQITGWNLVKTLWWYFILFVVLETAGSDQLVLQMCCRIIELWSALILCKFCHQTCVKISTWMRG